MFARPQATPVEDAQFASLRLFLAGFGVECLERFFCELVPGV